MIQLNHNVDTTELCRLMRKCVTLPGEVVTLPGWRVTMLPGATERMARVLTETGASWVYGDFYLRQPDGSLRLVKSDVWQQGALREGWDSGPVWMVAPRAMEAVEGMQTHNYRYAALYAVRLGLQRVASPVRLGEPLCIAEREAVDENQWAYVDPSNRDRQVELEDVCLAHLKEIGAYLSDEPQRVNAAMIDGGNWPVEASVVIPVRNRVATIGDAVRSALAQQADFPFNVIVVDNHSDDGTSDVLAEIAATDPRLIHVVPNCEGLGIGGCWNQALTHPQCGRYAVQLDSDDIYESPATLARIVEEFRREHCAMVVGSYTLTDMEGNVLPPGLIDHREWTPLEGRNNLLRVNGIGAPRAFVTAIAREVLMPNSSYGEDYAMALALSRRWHVGRIFDSLYLCRRWTGNSDAQLTPERLRDFNYYKDSIRTIELAARHRLITK